MKITKRVLDGLCDFFLNRLENLSIDEADVILMAIVQDAVDNYSHVASALIRSWDNLAKDRPTLYLRLNRPERGDKTLRSWLTQTIRENSI